MIIYAAAGTVAHSGPVLAWVGQFPQDLPLSACNERIANEHSITYERISLAESPEKSFSSDTGVSTNYPTRSSVSSGFKLKPWRRWDGYW
jgi:hypothetical protein